jgi:putative hydrolase of the HAD superfamily
MAIEFLYFDLGNVLLSFSHDRMCKQMAAIAGVEAERVRQSLFEPADETSLQWRFERGDFDLAGAYEHFCQCIGGRPDQTTLYSAACDIFAEMPDSIALVRRLAAAGNRLGIMSNTNPADWAHVRRQFPFLRECFQKNVLSFEARAMKPHAAIYEYAVRLAEAPASNVFFVDDKPENVSGARAAGLDAVLFTSSRDLAAELAQRGVKGA